MPLYEYRCENCNENTEIIESREEREKEHFCEKCKGKLDRVLATGVGLSFKGHGFYCTDYGSKD